MGLGVCGCADVESEVGAGRSEGIDGGLEGGEVAVHKGVDFGHQVLHQQIIDIRDGCTYRIGDDVIKRRYREYYEQLLIMEIEKEELGEAQTVEGPVMEIQSTEGKTALNRMKKGKAPGPSEFQNEMVKILATEGEEWMLDLLRAMWEEGIMPKHWEDSLMASIFKQKGDSVECRKHRGSKLTEHGLKVLERALEERLREIAKDWKTAEWIHEGESNCGCHIHSKAVTGKETRGKPEALLCFCRFREGL
ncbi:uncharacterized protein [Palaemon carinicauda]|uniref:uncharacterized protein n=1 Tax=Palaemon carinicauda TaxID=392227 RepID=UPI0035B5BB3F